MEFCQKSCIFAEKCQPQNSGLQKAKYFLQLSDWQPVCVCFDGGLHLNTTRYMNEISIFLLLYRTIKLPKQNWMNQNNTFYKPYYVQVFFFIGSPFSFDKIPILISYQSLIFSNQLSFRYQYQAYQCIIKRSVFAQVRSFSFAFAWANMVLVPQTGTA